MIIFFSTEPSSYISTISVFDSGIISLPKISTTRIIFLFGLEYEFIFDIIFILVS